MTDVDENAERLSQTKEVDPASVEGAFEEEITRIRYTRDEAHNDVLELSFDQGRVFVPNGAWVLNNAALAVLAYIGVTPSTMEEAVGETIEVVVDDDMNMQLASGVIEDGKVALARSEWGPNQSSGTLQVF